MVSESNCVKLFLSFVFGFVFFFGGVVQIQAEPLSLEMLVTGLKSTTSGMSLAAKNSYIEKRVSEIGVYFVFTTQAEQHLRAAGGNDLLIETVRRKAPKILSENEIRAHQQRRETQAKQVDSYTKTLESNSKDAEVLVKRAMLYEKDADYLLALEDYVRALAIKPDHQTAKTRAKRILEDFGDFFYTRVRRSDSVFERDAFVKGYISLGENRRREMMLNPPFYRGDNDKSFGDRKTLVYVLAFVNEKGSVVSASEISNEFWVSDSAIKAAKSSSFFEKRNPPKNAADDWVILIYEYSR